MPGLVALMHPGGGVLQASPLWRRQMDGAWPDGDWRHGLDELDVHGRVVHASEPCTSRFGALPEGTVWSSTFSTASAAQMAEALQARAPFELTIDLRADEASGGRERVVHCAAQWLADSARWLCMLVDVTANRRAGDAAQGEADFLVRFSNAIPIMISFYDRDMVLRYANRQYAQLYGHDESSIVGRPIDQILGEANALNLPFRNRAMNERTPVTFSRSLERGEGKTTWLLVTISPLFDESQTAVVGAASLTQDITRRRVAEMALIESEDRLAKFMDANAEGVVFHDRGIIVDVNPAACRLLGADTAQLMGSQLLDSVPDSYRPLAAAMVLEGQDIKTEAELRDAHGRRLPVEIIGRSIQHGGEQLRVTVIRDIRDRREAQARIHELIDDLRSQKDRAEAADRAKSVFLAAASHDLRQPIHALGLFLTALRAMAQAPAVSTADLAEICRRMQSSLDGLGQLLNMLLDVSRLDANAVQVERVPTPVSQIFVELDQDFAELALEKGLSLHVVSCSAWVHTDPTVLRRILSNLMSNAIRYTSRGRVVLGARPRGKQVEIQVWDSGIGIPPEQLDAIFEEFYQIGQSQARRDETHGLGLGLSIVQRSARLLEARLQVCSHPGRGSMFSITLPRCEPPAPAPPSRPLAETLALNPHAPLRSDARRVLVIDDEEQVLRAMQQLLEVWGHQVWCASSADEAVVLAIEHAHDIDLLISDYRLGGNTTAMHAISAVHACLPHPVPTYILTGDTSPQRIQEASDLGFPLLHKPVDPAALWQALEGGI